MDHKIITYFLNSGWDQSHSETPSGCIFERMDDNELIIIVVNPKGQRLDKIRMNRYAIDSGVAGVVVNKLYESLNQA